MSTLREMAEAVERQERLQKQMEQIAADTTELERDAADLAKFANDSADLDAVYYGRN
jgi:hypothetical protein